MWVVVLVKPPRLNDFRADFFPRRFAYKRDAEELARKRVALRRRRK